jgi:hypothetical protein
MSGGSSVFFFLISNKILFKKREVPRSTYEVYTGTTKLVKKKKEKKKKPTNPLDSKTQDPQEAHNTTSCEPCFSNA